MPHEPVHIVGAGPAGLTAAIALARGGRHVIVHDQRPDAGTRFHGDLQGIENWTWSRDFADQLRDAGVHPTFRFGPVHGATAWLGASGPYRVRSSRPLFYAIERGGHPDSLDQGLKRQAVECGVEFRWNDRVDKAPPGPVIVATGPREAQIAAKGIVFETDLPDTGLVAIDNRIAPKGYAYLLAHHGRGTLATCVFDNPRNVQSAFENTLARFQQLTRFSISQPRDFGGYGNFAVGLPLVKAGRILYVGEAGGFQDFLWGFGLHYAILSGHLAARSLLEGVSYVELCRAELLPLMETSIVNRWLFERFTVPVFRRLFSAMDHHNERAVSILRAFYRPSRLKRLLLPLARRRFRRHLLPSASFNPACDCIGPCSGHPARQATNESKRP